MSIIFVRQLQKNIKKSARTSVVRADRIFTDYYAIALSFFARPDFLLAAVFFLRTPLETAPSIVEHTSGKRAVAAALSPPATTARNFLIWFFT